MFLSPKSSVNPGANNRSAEGDKSSHDGEHSYAQQSNSSETSGSKGKPFKHPEGKP